MWDWLLSCRSLQGRPQAEFLLQSMLEARRKAPEIFPNPPAHKYHHRLPATTCAGKENGGRGGGDHLVLLCFYRYSTVILDETTEMNSAPQ